MALDRTGQASSDFGDEVTGERLAQVAPGDVLRHDFMEPLGLSARAVAREMEVPDRTGVYLAPDTRGGVLRASPVSWTRRPAGAAMVPDRINLAKDA